MSIKFKVGGAIKDLVGSFGKQGGVYGSAGVFAKASGAYQAVGGGSAPLDFIGYGQSNWVFHTTVTTGGTPPAAHPDTFIWDPATSQWVAPAGTGVRTFLNSMQAATGRVCRLVWGGTSGANIANLQKGQALYTELMGRITASGINPSFILWHQGEGDANTLSPSLSGYRNSLAQIHADLAADTGKTVSQVPLVCSSLATVTGSAPTAYTGWATIQSALTGINEVYPNIHYSHSNVDAVLFDGIHWDGPSYGRSGARYAQTVQFLMGSQSTRPLFFTTLVAERLSTTTTRVDVTPNMGTDFTPTSGITGFEVSNNNGTDWVSATGARFDADSITLTHADLGTTQRLIRYQFGKLPNTSAPVKDNGPLAVPLNFTTDDIVAPGTAVLPVPTFRGSAEVDAGATDQARSVSGLTLGSASGSTKLLIAGITIQTGTLPSVVTVTPNSGSPVILTRIAGDTGNGRASLYAGVVAGAATSFDLLVEWSTNPFGRAAVNWWTCPTSDLASTTPVDGDAIQSGSASTLSRDISTTEGGFLVAVGFNSAFQLPTTTGSDETLVFRAQRDYRGGKHTSYDASNTSAQTDTNTVVLNIVTASQMGLAVASFR